MFLKDPLDLATTDKDDWFLFSGEIRRMNDLEFIQTVADHNEKSKTTRAAAH